ncbi:fimbrial biogenesis chaperone [Enterobacter cloacae]|uniref:fimbrial biogenesis chaperone n=1 Tax=Enterobacter cloacae TaxID=550 RepID=UPI00079B9AF8|nr:molecular chaperone [Enterobacter cloacae]CZW57301.1 Pili assembly chaperone%2C N-terminal protein [Enterobacter cloacae]
MMRILLLMFCLCLSASASAGLVAAATRVIFNEGETQKSLMLVNANAWPVVVQSWVDHGDVNAAPGSVKTPFVAIPAVFRLSPDGGQGLRLVYNNLPLPADRESVFWLNLYEIPPVTQQEQSMVLTMNTQMKIFWRPRGLGQPDTALKQLTFRLEGGDLLCHNASPYFVSFAELALNSSGSLLRARQQPDMMVAPFSEKRYPLEPGAHHQAERVQVDIIDDNGNREIHRYPVQ